jgi:hypothetical protein
MDAPVTRREIIDALDNWAGAIIERVTTTLTTTLTTTFTTAMAAMEARLGLRITAMGEAMIAMEGGLRGEMRAMEGRLMHELGRATRGSEEELTTRIKVVDEQYKDLPPRVQRLEAKVFAPPKRRAATVRRRKRS